VPGEVLSATGKRAETAVYKIWTDRSGVRLIRGAVKLQGNTLLAD
jgi:hypothetical protein